MPLEIITEPELRAFRKRFNNERNFMSVAMKNEFFLEGRNSLFYEPSAWLLGRIQQHSPYWTGNLKAAHAMDLTSYAVGYVKILWHIEEGHIHPIIPEEAYQYGDRLVEEGRYENWFLESWYDYSEFYMDEVENAFGEKMEEHWRGGPS